MLLSQLTGKTVYFNGASRGVCLGVGLSPKTFAIKYLFCADGRSQADFALPISSLQSVSEHVLVLSKFRAALPKACARLFLGLPVYSQTGNFLGKLQDVRFEDQIATRLFTDRNAAYAFAAVGAISDALILRKLPPYPIGQRIPAPLFSEKQSVVTRSVLRGAIEKNSLVRLTLSLPPFGVTPNTLPPTSISPRARR